MATLALLETYLKAPAAGQELEARYRGVTAMKRFEYFSIVRALMALGFRAEGDNRVMLRIYANGCRVEISGFLAIEAYCTNEVVPSSAVFVKKSKPSAMVENDYGMRLALAKEVMLEDDEIQTLRRQWTSLPKKYRYLNRKRLVHPLKFPHWAVDCTITKSSYANVYRFGESDLFSAPELCEIETEAVLQPAEKPTAAHMLNQLSRISTVVVGGLQGTPYPVTHKKLTAVLADYQRLVKVNPSLPFHQQFVAPNPVALQIENLVLSPGSKTPGAEDEAYHEDNALVSVLSGYAVTDKADGVRKLLFVNGDGELFFITSRLGIEYTNSFCPSLKHTILDGEYVEGGLYAAFDAYFVKGEDVRSFRLDGRLEKLRDAVAALNECSSYRIFAKTFYREASIYDACTKCLAAKQPYETDGLIFTPVDKAVGVSADGVPPPNKAYTWDLALKWKPPLQTTIDFLVKIKEKLGDKNLVVLNVLYRGSKNWALPQTALLEQSTHIITSKEGVRPFLTEEDSASHLCYLNVVNGDMTTTAGETIKPGDVVEFSYYPDNADLWKWQALKLRVDKETPNTYVTAYNNWNAIFHPIDPGMLQGTTQVPDPHKYYVGNHKNMKELRQFHRYVKEKLLEQTVALVHEGTTVAVNLIDLGVGQAGDLNRWRNLKLNFVLGLDLNRDNITNRQEGACIRYLTTNKGPMRAIFAVADVSKKLFELSPPSQDLDHLIISGVFGKVPKVQVEKYPNLALHYNVPFHVTSCMFCVHYMFESLSKLTQFVDNVAEVTAVGGYFVGTAWDGKDLCALLRSVKKDESVTLDHFTVTKRFSQIDFVGDPVAVGYPIDVSQHTFHPTTEYLVDFQGLTTLLLRKGFKVVEMKSFRSYYTDDVLSENEKTLSFMNNVFIYQKTGIV
jgi:hypothetical protein